MPGWWSWFYYISPVAWTLHGLVASQLGDVTTEMTTSAGKIMRVQDFIYEYFGFRHSQLGLCVMVLVGFVLLFWIIFTSSIKFLNHQHR